MAAVEYIHDKGIVHRGKRAELAKTTDFGLIIFHLADLKPENLLFRDKAEDADIMIADFGLSRVMDEEKLQLLHEICGTPGVSLFSILRPLSRIID